MDMHDQVKTILAHIKKESFVEGYNASDAEAMGLLMSRHFGWDGRPIIDAAAYGLEDSNFHTEAGELWAMIGKMDEEED